MDLWAEAAPCLKDVLFLPGCTRILRIMTSGRSRSRSPPRVEALYLAVAAREAPAAFVLQAWLDICLAELHSDSLRGIVLYPMAVGSSQSERKDGKAWQLLPLS